MIKAYTGFPGSGKSLACTYYAMQDIKAGKKVFTSYAVKGAYKVTFEDLCKYRFPPNSTVIIDESGRWFNSRSWKDLPPEVFDMFTLHRHMQWDLVVAVQSFNRIDIALREVIEVVYWARNEWYLPFFIYDGYIDVENLGMKGESFTRHLIWRWTKARKWYDTHAMSSVYEGKDEMPLIPWSSEHADYAGRKRSGTRGSRKLRSKIRRLKRRGVVWVKNRMS